jgi:hypothetical protein
MTSTPCECPQPGWCTRHGCEKPPWLYQICRTHPAIFAAWEDGRFPCPPPTGDRPPTETPGLAQQALNLGRAVVRHVADGCATVPTEVYEARLAICGACPACDTAAFVCRDPGCGCYLRIKARWASEDCPRRKWPAVEDRTGPQAAAMPAE